MDRRLSAVLLAGIVPLALAGSVQAGPFDFLQSGKSRMEEYCDKMRSADTNYDIFYEDMASSTPSIYMVRIRGGADVTQLQHTVDKLCNADSVLYKGKSSANGRECALFEAGSDKVCFDEETGVPLKINNATAMRIEQNSEMPQPRQRKLSDASISGQMDCKRRYNTATDSFREKAALFGNFPKITATVQDLHMLYERFMEM